MNDELRILIADDQRLFADGLRIVLESRMPCFKVIGIAGNGEEAVEMTREHRPDVVLMDVRMPKMDGVVATRKIHAEFPDIKILILTTFDDDEYVRFSLKSGAIGYLLKNRPADELLDSVKALAQGIIQIDPAVYAKAFTGRGDGDEFIDRLHGLTPREREILGLLVKAKRIVNISEELGIAEQTVRNHISSIYTKLNIHDRLEIINYTDQIRYFLNQDAES